MISCPKALVLFASVTHIVPLQSCVKWISERIIFTQLLVIWNTHSWHECQQAFSLWSSGCHTERRYLPNQKPSSKEMNIPSFRTLNLLSKHESSQIVKKICSIRTIPDSDKPNKKSKMNQKGVKPDPHLLAEECYPQSASHAGSFETSTCCTSPSNT